MFVISGTDGNKGPFIDYADSLAAGTLGMIGAILETTGGHLTAANDI